MFFEGGVSPPGGHRDPRPGIGYVARRAGATVRPATSPDPAAPKPWTWPKITVTYGPPIGSSATRTRRAKRTPKPPPASPTPSRSSRHERRFSPPTSAARPHSSRATKRRYARCITRPSASRRRRRRPRPRRLHGGNTGDATVWHAQHLVAHDIVVAGDVAALATRPGRRAAGPPLPIPAPPTRPATPTEKPNINVPPGAAALGTDTPDPGGLQDLGRRHLVLDVGLGHRRRGCDRARRSCSSCAARGASTPMDRAHQRGRERARAGGAASDGRHDHDPARSAGSAPHSPEVKALPGGVGCSARHALSPAAGAAVRPACSAPRAGAGARVRRAVAPRCGALPPRVERGPRAPRSRTFEMDTSVRVRG